MFLVGLHVVAERMNTRAKAHKRAGTTKQPRGTDWSDLNIQTNLLIVVFFILEVLICAWQITPSLICTFHLSVFTHQSASLSSSNFTFLFKVLLFADPQKGM